MAEGGDKRHSPMTLYVTELTEDTNSDEHGYGDQDVVKTMSAAEPIVATRAAGSTAVQSVHFDARALPGVAAAGPGGAWPRPGSIRGLHANPHKEALGKCANAT